MPSTHTFRDRENFDKQMTDFANIFFDPYECPMFDCQVKFVPVNYSIISQNVGSWDGGFCLLRKQFSLLHMSERH